MTEEIIINNKCFIASQTDLKEYMDNITDAFYCEVDKCDEVVKLRQERDELKFENDRYKQLLKGCPTEDEDCGLCVIDEQNKRLKQENKELKIKLSSTKCYLCGEGFLTPEGTELYEEKNNYRSALEEIREVIYYCGYKDVVDKVLPKINEVLNLS